MSGTKEGPPTAEGDHLASLAARLEAALDRYEGAAGHLGKVEVIAPRSSEVMAIRAQLRTLRAECRALSEQLVGVPAATRTSCRVKRRVLRRYWEAELEVTLDAFRLFVAVCADADRLDANLDATPAPGETLSRPSMS